MAAWKYLLSTGRGTNKVEEYVIDLFKLYLQIWPGDIPGASSIGFDFILTDIKRADVGNVISSRVSALVEKIREKLGDGIKIRVDSVELIDNSRIRFTITINNTMTETINVNI